jgi:spermidine synthase
MSLYVDERQDGSFAFYMEGDIQFDSRDEAIYHESLVLPALALSESVEPEGRRILICGGGDGLALRECLRYPGVQEVTLVDIDDSVVNLGRTRFADLNKNAFFDPRVRLHIGDAWDFLEEPYPYDLIICDFTVPRRPDETRIFTQEWYTRLRASLTPQGMLALNSASPEHTPEAFWCIKKSVRSAGLYTVPYRVCIPSFRNEGYGAWGFMLASSRAIGQAHLRKLDCLVPTVQTDMSTLWRGAQFSREHRLLERTAKPHTLDNPRLLPLLLNPGLELMPSTAPLLNSEEPFSLEPLLDTLPIQHPYHTREMIEALAGNVIGSVRSLNIPRLIEALLARASQLPSDLVRELERLREFLRLHSAMWETFGRWCYRLFAVIVVIMTMANMIMPDAAFGKGSFGIGRASMSRGYSSGYRTSTSSFSGSRGFGGSFGTPRSSVGGSFGAPRARISSTGFRRSYGNGGATDIYGNPYRARTFNYYDNVDVYINVNNYPVNRAGRPIGTANGRHPLNPPPTRDVKALFIADEDMMVLENGDVVITLSEEGYLLLRQGRVFLMSQKEPAPLLEMFADTEIFQSANDQLRNQSLSAQDEQKVREDWLGWVSWTSAMFPTVAADKQEVQNLADLRNRIDKAINGLGKPKPSSPVTLPPGAIELFAGCYLLSDQTVILRRADGNWVYTRDAKTWWDDKSQGSPTPCPPALQKLLQSIVTKVTKETTADIQQNEKYLSELAQERTSLESDLRDYQNLANSYGYTYEVDYGTDSMAAEKALELTQRDLSANTNETTTTQLEQEKLKREFQSLVKFRF